MNKISIDKICDDDFLTQDLTEHYLHHREQRSGFDIAEIERLAISIQSGGDVEMPRVHKENGVYRVHADDRELISAYHYTGITAIPVEVMNPNNLEIPAYLRKTGKPLNLPEDTSWS